MNRKRTLAALAVGAAGALMMTPLVVAPASAAEGDPCSVQVSGDVLGVALKVAIPGTEWVEEDPWQPDQPPTRRCDLANEATAGLPEIVRTTLNQAMVVGELRCGRENDLLATVSYSVTCVA